MSEYLEGFLDKITIKALEGPGLPNFFVKGLPPTITMWYDLLTGTIYGFGEVMPLESICRSTIEQTGVLYNPTTNQPMPELPSLVEGKIGAALETALASIKAYWEPNQLS